MPNRGVVLSIVVIALTMMTMIAGFAMLLAYNQNLLLTSTTGRRIISFFRSQAGVVDAQWRVRSNFTAGLTPAPNPNPPLDGFNDPAYDPDEYGLNIDVNPPDLTAVNDPDADVFVNIYPRVPPDASGKRSIEARGKES